MGDVVLECLIRRLRWSNRCYLAGSGPSVVGIWGLGFRSRSVPVSGSGFGDRGVQWSDWWYLAGSGACAVGIWGLGFQARVGLLIMGSFFSGIGDELTIGGLVIGLTVRGSVMNS